MYLSHILRSEEILSPEKHANTEIAKPIADSRKIEKNDVFFCEDGFYESGFSYAARAVDAGAALIVTEKGGKSRLSALPIPVLEVENVRKSYARAWSRYENEPQNALRLLAGTGTNGKTSVASFLHGILRNAEIPTGLIGTVEYSDGVDRYPSDYTTPPPDVLYPLFSEMKRKNTRFAVMEASSHAIAQKRLAELNFETAIFTGLSRDHLDYHKTWEAYRDTKASLFENAAHALINIDDASAEYMANAAKGAVCTFGQNQKSDFLIQDPLCTVEDIRYTLRFDGHTLAIQIPLIGRFHIYNTAAAIAAAYLSGIPAQTLQALCDKLKAPAGRLEKLKTETDFSVFIDYAHSPDALNSALRSLRPFTKKLTVLFGAGGMRDKGKRPEMGKIAETVADRVILTSDNPRTESPASILDDIESGMALRKHIRIEDRAQAIRYALLTAESGEILLLAGKGHENYTDLGNGKTPFSEREIVYTILNENRKGKDNVSEHL